MARTSVCLALLLTLGLPGLALAQSVDGWMAHFDGPGSGDDFDWLNCMVVDGSGNVIVSGTTKGDGTEEDVTTIKYSPQGDTLWVRRYNAPEYNSGDVPSAIALDAGGDIYLTGKSWNKDDTDCLTLKYSTQGDLLWTKRYAGPGKGSNEARGLAVDKDGNAYVAGMCAGETGGDLVLIKYSPAGDTLWTRRYDGPTHGDDILFGLAADPAGNIYLCGAAPGADKATKNDYITLKYGPNGDRLWVEYYNGPADGDDYAHALVATGDGVCVTGTSPGGKTGADCTTIKYAANGDVMWTQRFDGPSHYDDDGLAIGLDGTGDVFVAAKSGDSLSYWDYATIKYSPKGEVVWSKRYNGPRNGDDDPMRLAVDAGGNVYVTGTSGAHGVSYSQSTGMDIATVKYSPAGELQWTREHDGPGKGDDVATALATDAKGNLYLAGVDIGEGTGHDFVVIKNEPKVQAAPAAATEPASTSPPAGMRRRRGRP